MAEQDAKNQANTPDADAPAAAAHNPFLHAALGGAAEAAGAGDVGPAGAEGEECFLWPCNLATWNHWAAVQTQWRTGMAGATGLDYAGVRAYLADAVGKPKRRREVFAGIRACERGALEGWGSAKPAK